MDEVSKNFEHLSIVSKVYSDIERNLGFGNKVFGEFIMELGRECETVDEFDAKLKENGVEMPNYVVRTLLTDIHAIFPLEVKGKSKSGVKEGVLSASKIKDSRDGIKKLEREIEEGLGKQILEEDEEGKYIDRRERRSSLFDEDGDGMLYQEEGVEEEIEMELNDDMPPFLYGLSCSTNMSPVEIFKNPEGSLCRAATFQSTLMKERVEKRLMKDYPLFDQDRDGMLYQEEGAEKTELDEDMPSIELSEDMPSIELSEDMPPFLHGPSCDMSSVQIFKNPGGSLSRAAVFQFALMKERMEKQLMKDYPLFDADGDRMLYQQEGELEIDFNEHKLTFLCFSPKLEHQKRGDYFGFGGYGPNM